jgi:glycine cleavage system aminomethyltransferase T
VLRLEKLHVIIGQDTDSESTPFNTDMGWLLKLDKPQDFIGRWALEQTGDERPATQLVGFTVPSGKIVPEGAVVLRDGAATDCQVTSSRWSPLLQASIGMATVPSEMATEGAHIQISYAGQTYAATVTTKAFYDPDGEALRS